MRRPFSFIYVYIYAHILNLYRNKLPGSVVQEADETLNMQASVHASLPMCHNHQSKGIG